MPSTSSLPPQAEAAATGAASGVRALIDIVQVSEHVRGAAHCFHQPGTLVREAWGAGHLTAMLHGQAPRAVAEITAQAGDEVYGGNLTPSLLQRFTSRRGPREPYVPRSDVEIPTNPGDAGQGPGRRPADGPGDREVPFHPGPPSGTQPALAGAAPQLLLPEVARRIAPAAASRSDPAASALIASALSCLDAAIEAWVREEGRLPLPALLDDAMNAVHPLTTHAGPAKPSA
ncbi:hypothetical protein [Streptomyces sp. NPDC051665]|uniref:hypothetical protein n=1 Tax=Streptomyces sp. NPDC051665 TaxID=3154647 RepID=UPI0034342E30